MNSQMKKGVLDVCVLSLLGKGDRYGYELTEELAGKIEIAPGTLYLVLKRLKDEECVETYLKESEAGPARKYYHLTEKGYGKLVSQQKEWKDFISVISSFLE